MQRILLIVFITFFGAASLFARGRGVSVEEIENPEESPWYTGSILAFSGHCVPKGYGNVEVYGMFSLSDHNFTSSGHRQKVPTDFTIIPLGILQFGITDWMDITFSDIAFYDKFNGQHSFQNGDMQIGLGFQLLEQKRGTLQPDIRVVAVEIFPTGKYQHLDPNKLGTDQGGSGSYQTMIGFILQKNFYALKNHPFRIRLGGFYTYRSVVHVHGLNVYGGGRGTDGKITFDPYFLTILAGEFSFTKNWVFAMDIQYFIAGTGYFQGIQGSSDTTFSKSNFISSAPKNMSLSLTPSIEYNFSVDLGIIAGVWFTVYGTNNQDFMSYVIALNYTFPVKTGK